MSPVKSPHGRTGRPPRTSRAEVLAAARDIIDRDGWQKLTIRRLAAEIGVGTMTVYHHIRDREDLLVQLVNDIADQAPRPDLPDEPRDRIVVAAEAIHDGLAAHPWATEIITTDGFLDRLGESALTMVETIVAGAVDCGCTPEQAVDVFRGIWYYTVGEIVVRANSDQLQAEMERTADREIFFNNLDASQQPHLAAIGDQWPALAARDTYRPTLHALVDGLLAQATPATSDG
ncbi:TetR/AcrR family transcriptional regulator [Phytoactinopolyspora limicola]|uniref:TetR/AcrR family transcriptional regulator n=1 Tax=Phytoactinopolyspora limicola TaxID=2715536 RepID=UPI001A9C705F|nr:TetR/AcrR family transcriptional regulator [Phytoactinopolyspora limicola]